MELLLLKKEVQAKLESLGQGVLESLPTTASKVIEFRPGMVDMGYIHDSDKPHLTRRLLSGQSTIQDEDIEVDDVETQTDPILLPCAQSTNTAIVLTIDEECQTEEVPQHRLERQARLTSHASLDIEPGHTDDDHAIRRQRRRERARASRENATRNSYPNELASTGVYEARYYSTNDLSSVNGHGEDATAASRSRRMRKYQI